MLDGKGAGGASVGEPFEDFDEEVRPELGREANVREREQGTLREAKEAAAPKPADKGAEEAFAVGFDAELRAFRIYDGPTEVHKWSLAKKIKKAHREAAASA